MATGGSSAGDNELVAVAPLASLLLRLTGGAGVLLLIIGLLYFAWFDLRCARDALAYPFSLAYGEGIVWQQALLIPGSRMYGPIDHLPFIVFHYPPVYHMAARAVMALGIDPLAAGRAVSIAATALILGSIAWLVVHGLFGRVGRSAQLVGAAAGALLPLTFRPLEEWFVLMRVDMLAIALGFLGVALTARATRRPAWLMLAMPAFVLSIYAKQAELAAPAAALAVLLVMKPRAAILAGVGGAILGLGALAWLEWQTSGGFLRHIIFYNVNTWSLQLLVTQLRNQRLYALLLAVAVIGLATLWPRRAAASRWPDAGTSGDWPTVVPIVSVWLLISLAMLTTAGKAGAWVNYFIEAMCICAIPAGMLVGLGWQTVVAAAGRGETALRLGLICVVLALVTMMAKRPPMCFDVLEDAGLTAIRENLVREIATQDRPVLCEDMVLLLRAGRRVPIEPAIFRELALTKTWDQRRFLDLIDARAFAFVVLNAEFINAGVDLYTPEVLAAMHRAYPRVEIRGPYVIRYPDGA